MRPISVPPKLGWTYVRAMSAAASIDASADGGAAGGLLTTDGLNPKMLTSAPVVRYSELGARCHVQRHFLSDGALAQFCPCLIRPHTVQPLVDMVRQCYRTFVISSTYHPTSSGFDPRQSSH